MTLKSFAERLGSIIETLQRINISFNLSKASLDPEDEFKADYLIDNLQQHVAKLLTIKVHSPEPVKQKGKAKQKQLITDNFDLEDEDFFSSPNKQKDNLDNVEIKTEITESPDKTEQNTAASKSDFKATPSGNVSNPEQIFVSGHRVSTEEDEDVTVKLEVEDAADVPDADAASDCTDEYVGGAADFTEEDAHDLTGGVNFDDDDDFDMEKEEEKMTNKPKRGRPSKSKTEQAKSTELVNFTATRSPKNEPSPPNTPHTDTHNIMCQECGLCFTTIKSYNGHVHRQHQAHDKFTCQICGKGFAKKNMKNVHELLHLQKRQYQCHICEKEYAHKKNLREHMSSHDGSKDDWPACKVCGKVVKRSNYSRHVAIHEEPKYKCPLCHKKFKDTSNLRRHARLCKHDLNEDT